MDMNYIEDTFLISMGGKKKKQKTLPIRKSQDWTWASNLYILMILQLRTKD